MQLHAQVFDKAKLVFSNYVVFAQPDWTFAEFVANARAVDADMRGWDVLDLKLRKYPPREHVKNLLREFYSIVIAPPELDLFSISKDPERLAALRLDLAADREGPRPASEAAPSSFSVGSVSSGPPSLVHAPGSISSASGSGNSSGLDAGRSTEELARHLNQLNLSPNVYGTLREYQKALVDEAGASRENLIVCLPTGAPPPPPSSLPAPFPSPPSPPPPLPL
eukprot:tig00000741_g3848.t1